MPVIMRLRQRFKPFDKQKFLEWEEKFSALEREGILPKGDRMMPIAAPDPGNTLIWQGRFESLLAAEQALHLMDTNPQHVELSSHQGPLIEDAWIEFYQVLDL